MDENTKDALFDIFKNQNEAALRSPTPTHLLNRSVNSAFSAPPLGSTPSTPINYNIPFYPTEHLFLNQQFNSPSANNYGTEENFSPAITTTILSHSNLSPPAIYLPHSRDLGQGFTEATSSTIIPGNSLQNPLSFNSFQPNLPTSLGSSHERMENQPNRPIRPLPMRGISPQLQFTRDSFSIDFKPSRIILPINDNSKNIVSSSLIKDNNNSMCQDEEVLMVSFDDKDHESINNQYDFELLDKDKGKQVIRESQSNQISEDGNCLELIKWHLKIVPIKDIPISEIPEGIIPEGIDFWMVLSGIVKGTRDKWHSGAVIAREHNRLVQTAKDKSYLLIGKLSAKKMKTDGFSERLIKAFEDGFPENWRELLLADLESLNDETSFSFKESRIRKRYSLREENSCDKRSNSDEESTSRKKRSNSSFCEEQSNSNEISVSLEISSPLEENISQISQALGENTSEMNPLPKEIISEVSPPPEEIISEISSPPEEIISEISPSPEENISEISLPSEEIISEVNPFLEEDISEIISLPPEENIYEISLPLEKQITSRQESNGSPNKKRFKIQTVQNQGEIVTLSGRHIRAPGNWWEVNPELNVKEEIIEPKRRRSSKRISSSTEKYIPSSTTVKHTLPSKTTKKKPFRGGWSRKRRSSQKGNAKRNTRYEEKTNKANSEETKVDIPRHEVYVLVETSKSE